MKFFRFFFYHFTISFDLSDNEQVLFTTNRYLMCDEKLHIYFIYCRVMSND